MIIEKETILEAWEKFSKEFDREKLEEEIELVGNAFNVFESEVLYSMIRLVKPKFIVEMSPDKGFTTNIILKACNKNRNKCEIYSFDLHAGSKRFDVETGKVTRTLIEGSAEEQLKDHYIENCDFMFIDSEHTYSFGQWYSENVLPKLKNNVPIWVHDWPMYESNGAPCNHTPETYEGEPDKQGEPRAVKEFFVKNKLGKPIMNCTDVLKEQGKEYLDGETGLSASQILVRTIKDESNSNNTES